MAALGRESQVRIALSAGKTHFCTTGQAPAAIASESTYDGFP